MEVLQDSLLNHAIFVLVMNDFPLYITTNSITLYAIVTSISVEHDNPVELQDKPS